MHISIRYTSRVRVGEFSSGCMSEGSPQGIFLIVLAWSSLTDSLSNITRFLRFFTAVRPLSDEHDFKQKRSIFNFINTNYYDKHKTTLP